MYMFLVILASIISIVLMAIVLMQASKGDGLSGTFGGAGGSSMGAMFGARRTADFLSKATWWLGGSLAVIAIAINLFFLPGKTTASQRETIIQNSAQQHIPQQPSLPPANIPSTNQQQNGQGQSQTQTKTK
jgi:preprotein translocase subunit SecG